MKINEEYSISKYLDQLKSAINEETEAIKLYDEMLSDNTIPESAKTIIKEINDDEKDHLVLLGTLFDDELSEEFEDYGDLEIEEE